MMRTRKPESHKATDAGLSLAEVLISVGLTGLLALGCTQLALASFTSANYTQKVAVKSLNSGNANRLITSDMESATGFIVPSPQSGTSASGVCTSGSTSDIASGAVLPLITLQKSDNSEVGYEVRGVSATTSLWRVTCPQSGISNGPELMIRSHLPAISTTDWKNSIQCASFPAGGSLAYADCPTDTWLTSAVTNPGIIFTIPATVSNSEISVSEQKIIAARNVS
jgi:hypothetical protein